MAIQQATINRGGMATRAPRPSNLAEVLDLILDKGIVIDAYVRVSVIGIELLTVDLRVVVASVDTYLRFAEAVNRLDLEQTGDHMTLQDLQNKGAKSAGEHKGRQALEKAKEKLTPGGEKDREASSEDSDGEGVGERVRGAARKVKERVGGGDDGDHQRSRRDREDGDPNGDNGGLRGMVGKVTDRAKWS